MAPVRKPGPAANTARSRCPAPPWWPALRSAPARATTASTALHRRDRVHRMGAAGGGRRGLGQAQPAHLACSTRRAMAPTVSSISTVGRRGAGSTGRCGPRPGGAGWPRRRPARSRWPLICRARVSRVQADAELAGQTTWLRRPAIARPTSTSLVCGPYTSAVSSRVTPRSSACRMTAMPSSSLPRPP
jgi:hypothetical protein